MAKMKKRPAAAAAKSSNEGGGGSQRALCVGIDEYESAPLAGCVADAKNWRALFDGLGFETSMLTNKKATRQAILDGLGDLIRSSSAGDVIVFQYAGHGTWFEDQGSDEDDSRDEAFCPVDMDSGAYLLDDDVRELFATLPDGVNLTCFIDCCHSGSITRALSGGPGKVVRTASVRPRFIKATPEMTRAHRAFRKKMGGTRAKAAKPSGTMRQIVFAACQDREVAYESNGHGDFTTRALEVLSAGFDGMTHATFQDRVITAFGANARQKPNLDCDQARREDALLAALGGRSTVPIAAVGPAAGRSDDGRSAAVAGLPPGQPASSTEVAELLRAVANLLT